jgi:hypothetical protein
MFKRLQTWRDPETGTEHDERFFVYETPREFADAFRAMPRHVKKERETRSRDWCGAGHADEVQNWLDNGRADLVASSDKFLSEFDDMRFNASRSAIVPAVCGGAPNVGAYLAGSPVAMRQRVKTIDDVAPLRIVVDIASSGGIDKKHVQRRGVAVLALARMLSAVRPVELYVGTCLGAYSDNDAHFELVRIDTAPLDLIRAAYLLTDISAARFAAYGLTNAALNISSSNWGYGGNIETVRTRSPEAIKRMFSDGAELLYIAPPFLSDESIKEPVRFVKEKLAEFGGAPVALADAA